MKYNLTEWSLKNKSLVYYFIIVTFLVGIFAYGKLGRMEDPDFTVRQMIVSVAWPGATARQVEEQVTDKIEKKLQDTPNLDYIKSYSAPGKAVITVTLDDDMDSELIRPRWLEVRNMVNNMKGDLPSGVVGPFYNDRFDDVYGSIYALTADEGYTYEEMRQTAERIRRTLLNVESVKKAELIGVQTEKIYVEVRAEKLAELGISANVIADVVAKQNTMMPSGMIDTESDNVYVRVSGLFESVEAVQNTMISANGRMIRLGDIATVERRYAEPAEPKMFYNGQEAIGIALSMEAGGNVLELGENLAAELDTIQKELPLGLELQQVSDQPKVVKESIEEFVRMLKEAVIIVLAVCFFSLGWRTGMVVALCIPLVIMGIFAGMWALGIDLHKISLGALIIALGLLVDDAIIAVEMMVVKLEEGWDRFRAACHAYTVTAFPMLTGTLITCAGFMPIGFAKGMAAEFTGSIFTVMILALLLSWIISVMVAPLIGYSIIRVSPKEKETVYDSWFYRKFRMILAWCLGHRKLAMTMTVGVFCLAVVLVPQIKQEFFPSSNRPEILVGMRLPTGASLQATEAEAKRLAQHLEGREEIEQYSYYVGRGAPRFVLPLDITQPIDNYAQFVIVTKDLDSRDDLTTALHQWMKEDFPDVEESIQYLQTGPPAPYPVMLRVSGYDHDTVREIAVRVAERVRDVEGMRAVSFDWHEKSKIAKIAIDQDKMRALESDGYSVSSALQSQLAGVAISEYYEKDRTIDVMFRLAKDDRESLTELANLPIYINGQTVTLSQIGTVYFDTEDGIIWRRDLMPTITVQGTITDEVTGNDATRAAYEAISDIREQLPFGYRIEIGGMQESSTDSVAAITKPVPMMIVTILTLLMLQLRRIPLVILTLLTAPLGIIGVSFGMLLFDQAMGFVAELGILALGGMIIRNSVILIDQIEKHRAAGDDTWNAIIDSAVLRFRPIMLTAAAAILGMIPLTQSVFWAPMAVAIASGLLVATVLTLLVLPTMYAIWFRVRPPQE